MRRQLREALPNLAEGLIWFFCVRTALELVKLISLSFTTGISMIKTGFLSFEISGSRFTDKIRTEPNRNKFSPQRISESQWIERATVAFTKKKRGRINKKKIR